MSTFLIRYGLALTENNLDVLGLKSVFSISNLSRDFLKFFRENFVLDTNDYFNFKYLEEKRF